jgi:hypothetical protein
VIGAIMPQPTRPFIVIQIVWRPGCDVAGRLAEALYDHYRRDHISNVAGGTGLSVMYRFAPMPGARTPMEIDFTEAETTAVVVLMDETFASDPDYTGYARDLTERALAAGLGARVFPVALERSALRAVSHDLEAIRWDEWTVTPPEERQRKLTAALTYEFCRMLRHYLALLTHPAQPAEALTRYLEKVRIFLSHSKHDAHGQTIAHAIRDSIHQETGLASFFDVLDIPAGLPFTEVLLHYVRVSAVVAIHTDSYSSREWCRREIIESKRANTPLVVANCITDIEERGFPYLGNVPVVRMEPDALHRIQFIIGRLLDETFKDFLWRCRIEVARRDGATGVVFLPRPPELISLVSVDARDETVVYPDPPIGMEEASLFQKVAPTLRLQSFTEWIAGLPPR